MLKELGRNSVFIGSMCIASIVGGSIAFAMMSSRGMYGPLVLHAESSIVAIGAALFAMAIAVVAGIVVGKVSNAVVGVFAVGGGLFGLAWQFGTMTELAFGSTLVTGTTPGPQGPALVTTDGPGLIAAAVETGLWSALVLGAVLIVHRVTGPLKDIEPGDDGRTPDPLRSPEALRMAAAGALVLPVVWFVAQSPIKGQVIGAVFLGSVVAGLVGRLISPHVQPILIYATPVLFGAVGHVAASFMLGDDPLAQAYVTGTLRPIAMPMPVDYACGSLMGVAFGLGWAKSFLHHEDEDGAR